ncbi:DUF2309 domain-containing protein [Falsiroseomonas sp. HW251]|uniref:DUF2309 domain-containing protein n=1 Tax=Falsiroseomonas sp. HW251 TaxID=3390998 RepID=UPI003D320C13
MPELARLSAQIEIAAGHVTPYWPLTRFIAANPLQGLEDQPFEHAARTAASLFGARAWPAAEVLKAALADGRIDGAILAEVAARHGQPGAAAPGALDVPGNAQRAAPPSAVNRALIRWLAAFLDEGQAAWPMPGREKGLWRAVRALLPLDAEVPKGTEAAALDADPLRAIAALIADVPEEYRTVLLTRHLTALAGWAGFVKWRAQERVKPAATLADLLALRLFLARQFEEAPAAAPTPAESPAAAIWLEAWEETWRRGLAARLAAKAAAAAPKPEAQLVFCIDVRSEVLRRHLERTGPWETLGFAGFFGAAVAVRPFGEDAAYASCPVLLQPRHVVPEVAAPGAEDAAAARLAGLKRLKGAKGGLRALKESLAGAFGFVEASGAAFGAAMVARTVAPGGFGGAVKRLAERVVPPAPTTPRVALACDDGVTTGLSPAEQVATAEGALRIMGLTTGFAPVVVLCGHGGQAVNNPFVAGLDCGACGGHRGGPNARIMAAILNDAAVRQGLAARGIAIPAATVFLAAEHDTTTDRLAIWDDPRADAATVARLRGDLEAARAKATAERLARLPNSKPGHAVAAAERRAADWAEPRAEWALARNAGFIVADRSFTRGLDLEGRCFLHSYDWRADKEGAALEVILTAPMVVAEWINTQYYFSTVDNAVFGAGSKVTHNVVGGFGVMQGNGSDLMTGLPAQSVMSATGVPYHEPLRLMTVVQAPLARVEAVVAKHRILQTLFGNGWVALLVADPETGRFLRRNRDGSWRDETPAATPEHHLIAA